MPLRSTYLFEKASPEASLGLRTLLRNYGSNIMQIRVTLVNENLRAKKQYSFGHARAPARRRQNTSNQPQTISLITQISTQNESSSLAGDAAFLINDQLRQLCSRQRPGR